MLCDLSLDDAALAFAVKFLDEFNRASLNEPEMRDLLTPEGEQALQQIEPMLDVWAEDPDHVPEDIQTAILSFAECLAVRIIAERKGNLILSNDDDPVADHFKKYNYKGLSIMRRIRDDLSYTLH